MVFSACSPRPVWCGLQDGKYSGEPRRPSQKCQLSAGGPSLPMLSALGVCSAAWAQILSLPRASRGHLDKSLHLSQPVSPRSNEGVNSVYYCTVLLVRIYPEQSSLQGTAHSNCLLKSSLLPSSSSSSSSSMASTPRLSLPQHHRVAHQDHPPSLARM